MQLMEGTGPSHVSESLVRVTGPSVAGHGGGCARIRPRAGARVAAKWRSAGGADPSHRFESLMRPLNRFTDPSRLTASLIRVADPSRRSESLIRVADPGR